MQNYMIENKDKNSTTVFLMLLSLIMVITVCVFNRVGYNASRFAVLLLIAISMFINIDKSLCLLVFCLPFVSILKWSAVSVTILPFLCMIIVAKIIFSNQRISMNRIMCVMLLLIIQLFVSFAYDSSLLSLISFFVSALFVVTSTEHFNSNRCKNKNLVFDLSVFLSFAMILSILLCDLFPDILYVINLKEQIELDSSGRFAAMLGDPNEYSQLVLISIALLLFIISRCKTKTCKMACILGMVYLCISGYRSYSKSYALSLMVLWGISIFIYLYGTYKQKGSRKVLFVVIPAFLFFVVGAVIIYNNVIVPVFEARSQESTDILTGRGAIWGNYIEGLFSHFEYLLFGVGYGNVTYVVSDNVVTNVVPHNLYLEYVAQFGIIGVLLLLGCWKKSVSMLREKKSVFLWLAMLMFLVTSFGISANSNDCIFVIMVILAAPGINVTNDIC